jgi:3-hydroxyacyl-CoA dehydrogenase
MIQKEIFRKLDNLCAAEVVLASNSSSLDRKKGDSPTSVPKNLKLKYLY